VNSTAKSDRDQSTTVAHEFSSPADSQLISASEGYERWAPTYDHAPNPLLAREERYLMPLFANVQRRQVLDVACGTGRWLDRLIAQGATGAGTDISLAMLSIAKEKRAISGRLARANCAHLPFPSAAFDLAICSFALGHIWELESTASELARVTKPGADLFVSDLHPEACAKGWRVGFRDANMAIEIETLPRAMDEIVPAFSGNGFTCLKCESLHLGNPEQPIFEQAGKSRIFAEACKLPAILICQFRRLDSQGSHGA
jgi:ubiquinone/menaquinone biosynthesis C-methylase UbiE